MVKKTINDRLKADFLLAFFIHKIDQLVMNKNLPTYIIITKNS